MVKEVEIEWTDRSGTTNRAVELVEESMLEEVLQGLTDAGYTIIEVRDHVEPEPTPDEPVIEE